MSAQDESHKKIANVTDRVREASAKRDALNPTNSYDQAAEAMLVRRLLERVIEAGVIVVAASPSASESKNDFPSSMSGVIGIGRSIRANTLIDNAASRIGGLFAPGDQIMVAIPDNQYDFRSGSSLAAAHVSGVVALLLSVAPDQSTPSVHDILLRSQVRQSVNQSVNACEALELAYPVAACER